VESAKKSGRAASIDYLRAFVTLLVLYHHSTLAYTTFAHQDRAHFLSSTAPIVDIQRWAFLDYAENFNDVFFMSLMFFISGLFVWPLLKARGPGSFLRDRLLRLGLPFLVGVVLVMPFAYYPSWLAAGGAPGYFSYLLSFVKAGWSPGPLWFLWLLLLFDAIAALVFLLLGKRKGKPFVVRSAPKAFLAFFLICFFVYVPMLARFGFGTWVPFGVPPLYFQLPRIFLYLTWFFGGVIIGAQGLQDGILAEDGALSRQWPWWIAACVVAYNLLWFVPAAIDRAQGATPLRDLSYVIFWVASCCASCFGLLALFRALLVKRHAWMDSFTRSAYLMYAIHYVYVTWAQYLLLGVAVHAAVKFAITCVTVVAASWLSAWLLLKIPRIKAVM
jgi:hypothetical protein